MSSNLVKRSVTGILFVVVMVGCILAGPIPFAVLFALITALAVREFSSLANAYGGVRVNVAITSLGGAYLFDFALRRCPHCGKHFSIVETPKEYCPFCGKKLN